jgi:hypothetical protein
MSNEIERLMIIQLECYLNAVTDMKKYSGGRMGMMQVQCMAKHVTNHVCLMPEVHFQCLYRMRGLYFRVNYTRCKEAQDPVFNPTPNKLYFAQPITSF